MPSGSRSAFTARMHCMPVVMRVAAPSPFQGDLPLMLLGLHSSRLDFGMRGLMPEEAVGPNGAWHGILMALTQG